jgi:biotin carboxyl carrier protein
MGSGPSRDVLLPNSYGWLRLGISISLLIFACFLADFALRASKSHGPLNDAQITQFLGDEGDVSGVVYGLEELQRRIESGAPVQNWASQVLNLSESRFEDVRHATADVMAKTIGNPHYANPEFQAALLKLLDDPSPLVRMAAAPPLATAGVQQARTGLLSALEPMELVAPHVGRVDMALKPGSEVRHGEAVILVFNAGTTAKVAAPFDGHVTRMNITTGDVVSAGMPVGEVTPSPQHILVALHGLQVVGRAEDIGAIRRFEQNQPADVVEQARATERSILARSSL